MVIGEHDRGGHKDDVPHEAVEDQPDHAAANRAGDGEKQQRQDDRREHDEALTHHVEAAGALRTELHRITQAIAPGVDERVLGRAMMTWTELLGAVSFELFGHFANVFDERDAWFEYQMRNLVLFIGLTY